MTVPASEVRSRRSKGTDRQATGVRERARETHSRDNSSLWDSEVLLFDVRSRAKEAADVFVCRKF